MADLAREAVDVRRNMERLRALREAREASEAANPTAVPKATDTKKKRKKTVPK